MWRKLIPNHKKGDIMQHTIFVQEGAKVLRRHTVSRVLCARKGRQKSFRKFRNLDFKHEDGAIKSFLIMHSGIRVKLSPT